MPLANEKEQQLADFEKLKLDPYTYAVLRKMGVDTLNSFTEEQRQKLIESISACRPLQKHPVDLRGVISFFFVRFYFVLLMGRDKRKKTKAVETNRRKTSGVAGGITAGIITVTLGALILLVIFFLFAYGLKSAMGINIFPDRHLCDFFNSGG